MSKSKKKDDSQTAAQPLYRATTGLENADSERVERGEELPADFVSAWQLEHWLQGGDIVLVESATEDQP